MIARVRILLPFALTLPENEDLQIHEYETEGYRVRGFPPTHSERADSYVNVDNIDKGSYLNILQMYC